MVLCTDRHLVYSRLPVDRSPVGNAKLMVMVKLPPWEQGGASYVLGPWARLFFFFLDLLCEFGVSFLPKSTKL